MVQKALIPIVNDPASLLFTLHTRKLKLDTTQYLTIVYHLIK